MRTAAEAPRRSRTVRWLAAAALVVAAVAAFAVFEARRDGSRPATPRTILLRIDPGTLAISRVDAPADEQPLSPPANLGGTLLGFRDDAVERRDVRTGALESAFPVPSWFGAGVGGGAVWLCRSAVGEWRFSRFDPLSGREIGHAHAWNCNNGPMTSGPGGMWLVDELGNLVRFDPLPPYQLTWWDEIFRFPIQPFLAVPYGRGVWLIDAASRQLLWYEPATGHHRMIRFRADEDVLVEGVDPYTPERVWIVDPVASEVVALGEGVEDRRHRIPIVGSGYAWLDDPYGIADATSLDGKLWAAFGSAVVAIPEDGSSLPTTIPMPSGFEAQWIVSDARSHSLWVAA